MASKRYQLDNYKRHLLNRATTDPHIVEYIENCVANEDENVPHTFHKIMVHNWSGDNTQLYDTMSDYYSSIIIPVNCTSQGDINTFYTSSLYLILKIIKFDFMFPFCRNMFNIDVLFNDKSSVDLFDMAITVENIVNKVVSVRFTEKCELDLSNICNDTDFTDRKINFYKVSLLCNFKILMLRMGKDTKALNLSNNNLSQAPIDLLNFFIKGDLIAINLSNNNIPSLSELQRMTSKIEKLWLDGNPLCEEFDSFTYVKNVIMKFPRLTELDGIKLNQHGMGIPFFRNYLVTPDKRTKMIIEKFVILYFTYYDFGANRNRRLESFYDDKAMITISSTSTRPHYVAHSRNMKNAPRNMWADINKMCYNKQSIYNAFSQFPQTVHDMTTFNVDVIQHDKKSLIFTIDGVYKEVGDANKPELYFQFRRTFALSIYTINDNSVYHIMNEMFCITSATEQLVSSSFKNPIRNMNTLSLANPDFEDCDAICKAFQYLTQLKKTEVESRLRYHDWNIKEALNRFIVELKSNKISTDRFVDEDDFSDTSSLLDEID